MGVNGRVSKTRKDAFYIRVNYIISCQVTLIENRLQHKYS